MKITIITTITITITTTKKLKTYYIRGGSRTAATSKLGLFVIIVNGFQPLTIITKSSTLDVAVVLDPPCQILRKIQQERPFFENVNQFINFRKFSGFKTSTKI